MQGNIETLLRYFPIHHKDNDLSFLSNRNQRNYFRLNEFPLRENCLTRFLFARLNILWGFVYFCIQKISLHETFKYRCMKHSFRFLWNVLFCLCPLVMAHAEDGSDRMENLIYSPRYFGPNAFPMPTLRDGQVSQWYEAELRGEYHAYTGDKTWDLRGRLLLPFFRGRAGVEIDWCFKEKYKMTPETRDERFAAGTEGGKGCRRQLLFPTTQE